MLKFYGEDPQQSADVSRIINDRHAVRISKLLDDPSITIEVGGVYDPKVRCDKAVSSRYCSGQRSSSDPPF
jgi:hypothetical protein